MLEKVFKMKHYNVFSPRVPPSLNCMFFSPSFGARHKKKHKTKQAVIYFGVTDYSIVLLLT